MLQRVVFALIATTLLGAPAVGKPHRRPNVLFLLSDDQRPDTIAALGNPHIETPHLDRLAARGTVFTRATCANPICTPSRVEILTGQSGFTTGVRDFGGAVPADAPRWPAVMRAAGYRTGFVGKWHIRGRPSEHGYDQTPGLFSGGGGRWAVPTFDWNSRPVTGYRGWVFQTDDRKLFPERGIGLTPDISGDFADAAIEFLGRKSDKPFFLHVNFTAPHDPLLMPFGYERMYDPAKLPPPENFQPRHPFDHGNYNGRDEKLFEWPRSRRMVSEELAVYYAVISHMDEQLGRILAALARSGRLENTIVVFSSDHGLAVGSHGLRGKQSMYEHTIGVPLIVAGPGVSRGRSCDAQCYLRDLFPTTCDLCGVGVPKSVEGRSLKPVLDGKAASIHEEVFGYFRDYQRMIRTPRWKLIEYPKVERVQLFDLRSDPHELRNLSEAPSHAARKRALTMKLRAWQSRVRDPVLEASRER